MPDLTDYINDVLHVLNLKHQELINVLRTPTPLKFANVFNVLPDGCIGSGTDDWSDPETIWECPISNEAWIHRIIITSPRIPYNNPLTSGEMLIFGSTGQIITWTPRAFEVNQVVPAEMSIEGILSAPHLSPGEKLLVVGDGLPVGVPIRFDIQVNLSSGESTQTPFPFIGSALQSANGS